MSNQTLPESLERLKNLLEEAVENGIQLNPQRVKEITEQANVQQEDVEMYADFDHPLENGYGRSLVYDAGKFEIMVMSWNPGDYSSIHNHGYTQWGVVQAFGDVYHMSYTDRNGILDFSKKEIFPKGSIAKVNNALIHQMGNVTSDRYCTMHIYGCNDRDADITADARNYEIEFDRVGLTTGGAFFNLPEGVIRDFEPGPKPSREVFLHHASQLLKYYERIEQTDRVQELKENILTRLREHTMQMADL